MSVSIIKTDFPLIIPLVRRDGECNTFQSRNTPCCFRAACKAFGNLQLKSVPKLTYSTLERCHFSHPRLVLLLNTACSDTYFPVLPWSPCGHSSTLPASSNTLDLNCTFWKSLSTCHSLSLEECSALCWYLNPSQSHPRRDVCKFFLLEGRETQFLILLYPN